MRLAWGLFALWLGLTVVFLILYVAPRDPARLAAGPNASPQAVDRARARFGYNEPIAEQYVDFFGRVIPVEERALEAVPATLSLLGAAMVVWLGLGIGGGLLAARWNRRWAGRPLLYLAIGLSPIWLALWLSYFVVYKLEWLQTGYCEFFNPPAEAQGQCGGAADWVQSLVLPALVLALFFGAIYARMIARIVRVPGEGRKRKSLVIGRLLARDLGYAVGVATLVELSFGIPGLGRTTLIAIETSEARTAEAALFLALLIAISWHFLVDIVVGALDKRLRSEWPVAAIGGRE